MQRCQSCFFELIWTWWKHLDKSILIHLCKYDHQVILYVFCSVVICSQKIKYKEYPSFKMVPLLVSAASVKHLRMVSKLECTGKLYSCRPVTNSSPIGGIGWTRDQSCNLLILLCVFFPVSKTLLFLLSWSWIVQNYSMPAAVVFTMCEVKDGKKSDTWTLLSPFLSPPISLASRIWAEFDRTTLTQTWHPIMTCSRYRTWSLLFSSRLSSKCLSTEWSNGGLVDRTLALQKKLQFKSLSRPSLVFFRHSSSSHSQTCAF